MVKRIRIMKHSKGSYEYNKELRLWELLDEQAEFELVFEKEKEKRITALLSREELLMLKDSINEALERGREHEKTQKKLPELEKTAQKEFEQDFIQQKDSESLEEKEERTKEKRFGR